mmetsp:Transcript_26092/g.66249  ORF Transcript_26092/g.66249 Transcript_26092/m.66249 type:complete len:292 (+) Transcript_26092:246-1121(+)
MASLSGAFQAASGLYLLFERVRAAFGTTRITLLLVHAVVSFFTAAVCIVVWPDLPYGVSSRQPASVMHSAVSVATAAQPWPGDATREVEVVVPLKERHFWAQAQSAEFLLLLTFFSANALQCQFTVGTIGFQLELKGDTGEVTRVFSLALALSFLAAPFIGMAFDCFGFPRVFAAVNLLLLGVPAALLFHSLDAQYAACLLYSAGRVGLWASFFSFIGSTFGFKHYGKLAGGGLLVQSLFCLLQYPLLAVILSLNRNFDIANVLFCVLTTLQLVTIFALRRLEISGSETAK